ncbi:response regulator [Anaerocolumna sedimenticola]|uniref:Stage 0 sporulation protein A homolog n=1 Tax=Anaerocolumna sedimenticola TaxID=2696063 RepID=A0A6P1TK86_9FIRM|nr:response regulator transcription factor [Anaerocolumna sedimenticola]QHQ60843.1 response regulator [Anaerocolumna sedimenticola]
MHILVAEDEKDILNLITEQLRMEGYTIYQAFSGLEAWNLFQKETIDLALLDVMMPGMDGLTLLRKIRETSEIPVIFLTARGEEMDKVSGLSLGADDYMVKPFSLAELSARVAVQLRHLKKIKRPDVKEDIIICGELCLDRLHGTLHKRGKLIELNAKEYLLLTYMMENQEIILTKRQMYQAVWEEEYIYDDNTVMVHLSHIRNKIEDNAKEPQYMITFRGVGYKLTDPIKSEHYE